MQRSGGCHLLHRRDGGGEAQLRPRQEGKCGAGSPPAVMVDPAFMMAGSGALRGGSASLRSVTKIGHPASSGRSPPCSLAGSGAWLAGSVARREAGRGQVGPPRGQRGTASRTAAREEEGKRGREMSQSCWRRELMGHGPFTCVRPKPANGSCIWVGSVGDSLRGRCMDGLSLKSQVQCFSFHNKSANNTF
jgi:hypothetical protein